MFGREEFRPIIDGITIGLQVLLVFIGTLTLGIGGVGVANIMLVSVDERVREIGLRRALGARKRHIRLAVPGRGARADADRRARSGSCSSYAVTAADADPARCSARSTRTTPARATCSCAISALTVARLER